MLKSVRINNTRIIRVSKTMKESADAKSTIIPTDTDKAVTGFRQVPQMTPDVHPVPEFHGYSIPVIRCFRCGDTFPVTDFISTKKSGLCISCWKTKIPQCR